MASAGFRADAGEIAVADERHLLLGMGNPADLKVESLRSIGGKLVRALDRMEVSNARVLIADAIPAKKVAHAVAGGALAEGLMLANWRVDRFDGSATKNKPPRPALTIDADDRAITDGMRRGQTLGDCQNYARLLGATPPNICTPAWLTAEARSMARKCGLSCRVITFAEAEKLGMGGLVNVGKGSANKPCIIILEHRPPRARRNVKLSLVGKTMTYDTGGYSLKVNNGMKGMKYDKCGGMAVIGAMRALALLKVPVHVIALLPAAENMVSEDSYRPDDIITMYNGVSVEVTNTDAEGRLILGDALAYACKHYKPTAIVDAATLTGGVVVALGHFCSGYFCNDDALTKRLENAASATGEQIWRLPLWDEHREFMRARHADILNSNPQRSAHPIQGAAFLSFFVDESIPWAHIDIAGVANIESDKDVFVTGPTGYGVRLLTEFVASHA